MRRVTISSSRRTCVTPAIACISVIRQLYPMRS
jgi:hypothetical protein